MENKRIHVAGGLYGSLVIEPLGDGQYIYNSAGQKGRAFAKAVKDEEEKKILYYKLDIEGVEYVLNGYPLQKLLFNTPRGANVQYWIDDTYRVKSGKQLYADIFNFLKLFYDMPTTWHYHVSTLLVLTTWANEVLNTVIYGNNIGRFGAGKTVLLEAFALLFKHGYVAGNASGASIARLVDQQKLNTLHDEFDVKSGNQDSEEYLIVRQGYRRGNNYTRLKPTKYGTYVPDISDPFGVKVFSLHSELEKATKMRGLPISLMRSKDSRLPVINMFKAKYGTQIFEDLFFWYMDNMVKDHVAEVSHVAQISHVSDMSLVKGSSINELRQSLFDEFTKGLDSEEKDFILSMQGRNAELAFVAITVTKLFKVNVLSELKTAFEQKIQEEDEDSENRFLTLCRNVLVDQYNKYSERIDRIKDSIVFVPNDVAYQAFNDEVVANGGTSFGTSKFKEYLREFGFESSINRKKARYKEDDGKEVVKLVLFYDKAVLDELGLSKNTETRETQETRATGDGND